MVGERGIILRNMDSENRWLVFKNNSQTFRPWGSVHHHRSNLPQNGKLAWLSSGK